MQSVVGKQSEQRLSRLASSCTGFESLASFRKVAAPGQAMDKETSRLPLVAASPAAPPTEASASMGEGEGESAARYLAGGSSAHYIHYHMFAHHGIYQLWTGSSCRSARVANRSKVG